MILQAVFCRSLRKWGLVDHCMILLAAEGSRFAIGH